MLYAIVGLLVVILDQGVKFWITNNFMPNGVTEELIPGVISLVRMHNDGAAFSILAGGGARIYFIILTGIFTVAVILALATNFISGRFGRWCLVLVTAGGLSNCLDRVLYGYVVDMFKIDLFNFAVFNVADIFITVFCLLFIIYIIFGGEDEKEEMSEFDEDDEDLDRPTYAADLKNKRKQAKEEKVAATVEKRVKKRGSKYVEDDLEPDERFASHFSKSGAEPAKKRTKKRPSDPDADDMPDSRDFVKNPRPKKTRYEEEYEAFLASRPDARAEMAKTASPVRPVSSGEDDPFAAWEAANAKAGSQNNSYTAKAMGLIPKKDTPRANAASADRRPVEPVYDDARPKSAPPSRAKSAADAPTPAPSPKPATSNMEFSLDDILSEFR